MLQQCCCSAELLIYDEITGWFGFGRDLEAHLPPTLCRGWGHLQLHQIAHMINEYTSWKVFEVLQDVFTDKMIHLVFLIDLPTDNIFNYSFKRLG